MFRRSACLRHSKNVFQLGLRGPNSPLVMGGLSGRRILRWLKLGGFLL